MPPPTRPNIATDDPPRPKPAAQSIMTFHVSTVAKWVL